MQFELLSRSLEAQMRHRCKRRCFWRQAAAALGAAASTHKYGTGWRAAPGPPPTTTTTVQSRVTLQSNNKAFATITQQHALGCCCFF
jgi:hypothetical protein